MYYIVLLAFGSHLFSQDALSQPVTGTTTRLIRQTTECCPCPGSINEGVDIVGGTSQIVRASDLDDCPCRPRTADSEGASSIFFPSAVLNEGAVNRPVDPKEDIKNLLEPEVALATSMLDTLREATEEGYRDALDREAARSAAEQDAVPEESAKNMVIIVNPIDSDNDDYSSEASHVQESRCVKPLKNSMLGKARSSPNAFKFLPNALKFPKLQNYELLRNGLDSNYATSNVDESFIDNDPNFQKHTPKFKYTPIKSVIDNHANSESFKKPSFKFDDQNENSSNILKGLKFPLLPKLRQYSNVLSNNDLSPSASSISLQSDDNNEKISSLFRQADLPLHLRNLLNLKDVEIIPKSTRKKLFSKPLLNMGEFTIPNHFNRNQKGDGIRGNCNEYLRNPENNSDEKITKIIPLEQPEESFSDLNENANPKFNENNYDERKTKTVADNNENFVISPSASSFNPLDISESETTAAVSADNRNAILDDIFLESQELRDSVRISQHKETQNESNKIGSDTNMQEPNQMLMQKMDTKIDGQNLKAEGILEQQDLSTETDPETHSSNYSLNIMPSETQEIVLDIPLQSKENYEDLETSSDQDILMTQNDEEVMPSFNKKYIENSEVNSPLGTTLSNIRPKIVKNFETSNKPSIESEIPKVFENTDIVSVENENEQNIGKRNEAIGLRNREQNSDDAEEIESKEITKDISMNDLQHMSDKLLESTKTQKFANYEPQSNDVSFESTEIENGPTKLKPELSNKNADNAVENNSKYVGEHACLVDLNDKSIHERTKTTLKQSTLQSSEPNEMDTGASESIVNTLNILDPFVLNSKLKTPLFEGSLVKPLGDPLNILGKPLGDVLNINPNFPSLDNLRERLANVFNLNSRSVEDSFSIESDCTDESPIEAMAPEATTTNLMKNRPSLNNFKVDTFKGTPSTLIGTWPKIPKFNLNSYRAKIPTPRTLHLKPKNKSKLGNKPRMDIPSPTFESDKKSARKFNGKNLLTRNFDSFPTFDELRDNLRFNTNNLLNRPVHQDLNLFTENLRSNDVEDIAETIRLNTQKTMKGIQQKMKSTLKQTKLNSPLRDPFGKPQELLDDMNDKLKAIHYDLNDRISSFHDNILDTSNIKIFLGQPHTAANRNVMTNLRQNKPKPARLQTDASTVTAQVIDPNRYNAKQRDISLDSEPRNNIDTMWNTPQKMRTTPEFAPFTPTRVKIPKIANPTLSNLQKSPHQWDYPTLKGDPRNLDPKRPIFGTATNLFNDFRQPNKVTISFKTTTARPVSALRKNITPRVPDGSSILFQEPNSNAYVKRPNENVSALRHRLQPAGATRLSTIKYKPSESSDEEFDETTDNFSQERNLVPEPGVSSLESTNFDSQEIDENENTFGDSKNNLINKSSVKPSLSKEHSFLSKIKDAANKRVPKLGSKLSNKDMRTEQSHSIARSPSENTDLVFAEPLKENVSYRCRMVCTKEFS